MMETTWPAPYRAGRSFLSTVSVLYHFDLLIVHNETRHYNKEM